MRRYGQIVVAVASATVATYRTKHNKPRNSVDHLNVGAVEPAYSQTSKLISRLVQLHVTVLSSRPTSRSHQVGT